MSFSHPIHKAVENKDVKAVRKLLRDPTLLNDMEFSMTPFLLAIKCDQFVCVDMMISKGADLGVGLIDGTTSLHYAVQQERFGILDLLLRHATKSLAIREDREGLSILHLAARDSYQALYVILKYPKKLQWHALTHAGMSCVDFCIDNKDIESLSLILEAGYDINAYNAKGETPLHRAVANDYAEGVRLVIFRGANINSLKLNDNATALIVAAEKGLLNMVELLVYLKANKSLKNKLGQTAAQIAAMKGYVEMSNKLV